MYVFPSCRTITSHFPLLLWQQDYWWRNVADMHITINTTYNVHSAKPSISLKMPGCTKKASCRQSYCLVIFVIWFLFAFAWGWECSNSIFTSREEKKYSHNICFCVKISMLIFFAVCRQECLQHVWCCMKNVECMFVLYGDKNVNICFVWR